MKSSERSDKDGEWVHSACAMCLGAPMQVKVREGKIVAVKGENIPGWNGKVCGKAISGVADRVYNPDRILSPLKRVGKRGEGKFVRCSWEEVIDATAAKLKEYRDVGQPEAFEIWWGCPVQTDNIFFLHYWAAVLRAGISYLHGQVCFGDHTVEKAVTFGLHHGLGLVTGPADWSHTKYVVIAGQNFPGTGNNHSGNCNIPVYSIANKAKENGCKFVIVDPKLADASPWCDEWIPVSPGSDAMFALSIANVLIKEKLYDEDFLLEYTNASQLIRKDNGQALKDNEGHYLVWDASAKVAKPILEAGKSDGLSLGLGETFKVEVDGKPVECKTALQMMAEEAEKYPPEASEFPEKMVEVARNLGKNKPSVVFHPGFTSSRYPNWFQVMRCYSAVNLLLGNFEKPGGYHFLRHGFNLGTGWPEPPDVPDYREGIKLVPGPWRNRMANTAIDKAPCYTEPREFHPATVALPWLHFEAIEQGKVRAVLSSAENAAITQVNSKWVEECLKKLDLIIVGDQIQKEFSDLADYVIPEASYLERYHMYQENFIGADDKEHSMIYMRSAVIPPQGESKPMSWFLTEVAKKMGLNEYFENLGLEYEWWDRMLKNGGLYPKVTAQKLIEEGPYVESHPIEYNLLFTSINTRSGRFEIYSNELAEECYYNSKSLWYGKPHIYPMPIHVPIAAPKGDDEFHLVCGKATWHQKSATQHNPYLMEDAIEGDCAYMPIYLNTDRADKLGIKDGDLVEVECVGPTNKEDPCVVNDSVIGVKEKGRVKVTKGLHPKAAWTYFASGRKSKSMPQKSRRGITVNWLTPASVSPYAAGAGKNYSIVKIRKIEEGE
ncbi:molybdopterin-dependent oxidoreductase [Chloroflexota bacterium]